MRTGWEAASSLVSESSGVTLPMADGSVFSWVPAWGDRFCGEEGDLLIRLSGKKGKSRIHEVIIWSPEMEEHSAAPSGAIPVPAGIDPARPFVAAAYDEAGNPGIPHLFAPTQEESE